MSPLEVMRAGYGLTQLLVPGTVDRLLTGVTADRPTRIATRILGVRHLIQATVLASGSRRAHRLGAPVDVLHGASMLGLALVVPSRRRQALTSAATAFGFAGAEYAVRGRVPSG